MQLLLIGIILIWFSESKFIANSGLLTNVLSEDASNLTALNDSQKFDTFQFFSEFDRVLLPNGTQLESNVTSFSMSNSTDASQASGLVTKRSVEGINDFEVETANPVESTDTVNTPSQNGSATSVDRSKDSVVDDMAKGYFLMNSLLMDGLRYEDPFSTPRKRSLPKEANLTNDGKYDFKNNFSFVRRFIFI